MMETNPGKILQRMGIEVSPDDPRSSEQILFDINYKAVQENLSTEVDPERRRVMVQFLLENFAED